MTTSVSAATAMAAPAMARRRPARAVWRRRPELGAVAVVTLSWIMILALAIRGGHDTGSTGMPAVMPGMTGPPGSRAPTSPSLLAEGLPSWALMSVAMMGPAALAGIRHTAVNSLRWRRRRAMAEFATGYLSIWMAFGACVITVVALAYAQGQGHGSMWLACALLTAAAWQLTPWKRRRLRDCHRSYPLPPRGWRAEWGSVRFGLRNALACLGSCWCLMLVATAAATDQVVWTGAVTVLVTGEKLAQRPRRITRLAAIALSIAAAGAIYTPRVALVAGTLLGLAMAVGGRRRTRRRHDPAPGSSGPPASIQRQTFPI